MSGQRAPGGRWVMFVRVVDQGGVLTALAETFSSRGVSFESFNTLSVSGGIGVMSITFRGSDRLAHVLARTVERLAVTREVRVEDAAAPAVRAVAVMPESGIDPAGLDVVASWPMPGTVLVAGSLADVERAVAGAGSVEAIMVLPPAD